MRRGDVAPKIAKTCQESRFVCAPAARAPRAARRLPRRQASLGIFVVRCGLPCDPPVGGHSCNGGMITLPSRGLGRRPIYLEAPRMKKCCVSGEGTLSNFQNSKVPLPGGQACHNKLLVSWGPLVIAAPIAGSLLAPLRCAAPRQSRCRATLRPSKIPTPFAAAFACGLQLRGL